ncbi:MAG: hypothetical protein RR329_02025 [Mucinivorans sp.]
MSEENTNFGFDLQFFYDPDFMCDEYRNILNNGERFTAQTYLGLVQVVCYYINNEPPLLVRPDYDSIIYDDNLENQELPDNLDFPDGCYINTVSLIDDKSNTTPYYACNELRHNPRVNMMQLTQYPQTYGGLVMGDVAARGADIYCCATITQSLTLHPKFRTQDQEGLRGLALADMVRTCHEPPSEVFKLPGQCLISDFIYELAPKPTGGEAYKSDDTIYRQRRMMVEHEDPPRINIWQCMIFANVFLSGKMIVSWELVESIENIKLVTAIQRPASEEENAWKVSMLAVISADSLDKFVVLEPPNNDPTNTETQDYLIWTEDSQCWFSAVGDVEAHIQRQYVEMLVAYSCAPNMTPNKLPTEYKYKIYTYPVAVCPETGEYHILHDGIYIEAYKLHDTTAGTLTNVQINCELATADVYELNNQYIRIFMERNKE